MNFCSEMRDCATMYRKSLAKVEAELEKLNNSEHKGSEYHRKLLEEAEAKKAKALKDAVMELEEIRERYRAELTSRYMPKGEELTEDAKLFSANSPIELTEEEVSRYLSQYSDNLTMSRLIADYARARDMRAGSLGASIMRYSQEEKTTRADNLLRSCKSAITDPNYYDVVIANDANFAKITGEALAGE